MAASDLSTPGISGTHVIAAGLTVQEAPDSPDPAEDLGQITTASPLLGQSLEALTDWMVAQGQPAYRGKQLHQWLYQQGARSLQDITVFPKAWRQQVAGVSVGRSEIYHRTEARDGTVKYLLKLADGQIIEAVGMPSAKRLTVCVSSQVGCPMACDFCATGKGGFLRNLHTHEIVDQVLTVQEDFGQRVSNIVFMGMGEPLANFANLTKAITIINAHWGIGIGARHITVSTSGLAPQIEKLADFEVPVRLAISLHGASDEVRERIMPVNRKYPLDRLFEALRYWSTRKKQKITFEFILIEGVNDSLEQAELLARRSRPLGAKVNLIPYNTVEGLPWKRPSVGRQEAFFRVLQGHGIPCTLRREKGHDIAAACGQLRLKQETAEGIVEAPVKA